MYVLNPLENMAPRISLLLVCVSAVEAEPPSVLFTLEVMCVRRGVRSHRALRGIDGLSCWQPLPVLRHDFNEPRPFFTGTDSCS